MTLSETADAMRRCAGIIDKVVKMNGDLKLPFRKPFLEEEEAVGAAVIICYIRDLLTASPREDWDRPSFLVLLETLSRDPEVFPCGVAAAMWKAEVEDE